MTYYGGANGRGTIFGIGTDGNDFQLLHDFDTPDDDGEHPYGSLIQGGSTPVWYDLFRRGRMITAQSLVSERTATTSNCCIAFMVRMSRTAKNRAAR